MSSKNNHGLNLDLLIISHLLCVSYHRRMWLIGQSNHLRSLYPIVTCIIGAPIVQKMFLPLLEGYSEIAKF